MGGVFVPIDKAFLFLPIAPHSRGCLLVGGWVPVRIKQDQAVATNPDDSICTYAHIRAHSCYTSDSRQRVCGVWSTHKFNPHPPALLESRNTKMSSGAHMCWNELRNTVTHEASHSYYAQEQNVTDNLKRGTE